MTQAQLDRMKALHSELFDMANEIALSKEDKNGAATLLHGAASLLGIVSKNKSDMEEEAMDFYASAHSHLTMARMVERMCGKAD